ncbi:hypothetical protein [Rhodopirellula bahusiensis]|uniref:Secreted protein n=1 Tax=Rhodopirellula bahusiensis TaxID=2014065 RepID=A0A2G1W8D1_9BACT|nr:hypothetical protein [Rhodopirellula bahusiensis]PHQ35271.1 hypothetical protein CEE69_09525 [Rhodopirellula bahusiensis]
MRNELALSKLLLASLLALWGSLTPSDVSADDRKSIYFIEENWELTLGDPEPDINSPQVSFFVFPNRDDESRYFELQLNYAADATYSSGGFRVTAAVNDKAVDHERGGNFQNWSASNDCIRWTTVMAVKNSRYLFAIKNGESADWGAFGGPDYLVEMPHESGDGLMKYHPDTSLANVDIGFGANRVRSIRLKSIRVVFEDGSDQVITINLTPTSINS